MAPSSKQSSAFYVEFRWTQSAVNVFTTWGNVRMISVRQHTHDGITFRATFTTPTDCRVDSLKKSLITFAVKHNAPLTTQTVVLRIQTPQDTETTTAYVAANRAVEQSVIDNIQDRVRRLEETHTTIFTTNNITNNTNVTILNFGYEDLSHLDTVELVCDLKRDMINGLAKAINQVYFNPEKPENRTVRLKSIKHQLCEVMHNGEWHIQPVTISENSMIKRVSVHLRGHIPRSNTSSEPVFGEAPLEESEDDYYTKFSDMISTERKLANNRKMIYASLITEQQQRLTG